MKQEATNNKISKEEEIKISVLKIFKKILEEKGMRNKEVKEGHSLRFHLHFSEERIKTLYLQLTEISKKFNGEKITANETSSLRSVKGAIQLVQKKIPQNK